MAKKHSSKTATEKAISSSEPRVTLYRGWQGVNFVDAPLTWQPLETGDSKKRQTNLPSNFLMVQNNIITSPLLGLETRPDSIVVGKLPEELEGSAHFTGISTVYRHWLFTVVRFDETNTEAILYRSLLDTDSADSWTTISYVDPDIEGDAENFSIEEIGFYESNLVATVREANGGNVALAKAEVNPDGSSISIKAMNWATLKEDLTDTISSTPKIEDPLSSERNMSIGQLDWPYLKAVGMESHYTAPTDDQNAPVRLDVVFSYVNRMGSSLVSYPATIYVEYSPALWSSLRYITISSRKKSGAWTQIYSNSEWEAPAAESEYYDPNITKNSGITGIDFYARENENTDYVFIGHIDITSTDKTQWTFSWLGNMTDTSQWTNSQLQIPTENTSRGPNITHFTQHDSRLYYWGQPDKPYRLYIGGNPGSEFSVARGLGGAWVDIEPGSGFEIAGTAKWKTVSGANIVTIMCGNRNSNKVKRFNLVETSLSLTNEVSYRSYMYEEVSNVVGCNSRYGYGVYTDGLYALNRYGLMLTTMAMEYNSQMKSQNVSEAVKPIFTERIGNRLRDGRMVCIDDVIYIALSEEASSSTPTHLDNVILCYDISLKAWYTFTHDQTLTNPDTDLIHHIFAIDSDEYIEGLGAVTDTEVRLYPTTGIQEPTVPEFSVLIETGELMPRMPQQAFNWIEQLEFRFDYFIGDPDDPAEILIEGVDYYGRQFSIKKKLNIKSRGYHGLEGEQRDYVEWVRVGKIVESLRIRIKGKARFRLTHIINKMYTQSNRIGTPYGYDAHDSYTNRHGGRTEIHHYINDYNNLRKAIVS